MKIVIELDSIIQAKLLEEVIESGLRTSTARSVSANGSSAMILEARVKDAFQKLDYGLTNAN